MYEFSLFIYRQLEAQLITIRMSIIFQNNFCEYFTFAINTNP